MESGLGRWLTPLYFVKEDAAFGKEWRVFEEGQVTDRGLWGAWREYRCLVIKLGRREINVLIRKRWSR